MYVRHSLPIYIQGWEWGLDQLKFSCQWFTWLALHQCSYQNLTAERHIMFNSELIQLNLPVIIPSLLNTTTLTAFQRAHLLSMALANCKGHMNRSKGYCALWKTPSENTALHACKCSFSPSLWAISHSITPSTQHVVQSQDGTIMQAIIKKVQALLKSCSDGIL